jgi:enoyl-CoA hydratase/carnithine racemase
VSEVLAGKVDGILVLTLNRPDKANAMNEAMQNALVKQLDGTDPVVLCAAGSKIFSAGADLKEFSELDRGVAAKKRRELLKRTLYAILDFPKPLVIAVEGRAIGGGCMLAMLADELVMSETAELSLPEIKHGIPTPVGYVIVAARCGMPLARRMVQAGEAVGPAVADSVGNKDRAIQRAKALAALWGPSYVANKTFINAKLKADLQMAFAEADKL